MKHTYKAIHQIHLIGYLQGGGRKTEMWKGRKGTGNKNNITKSESACHQLMMTIFCDLKSGINLTVQPTLFCFLKHNGQLLAKF